MTKFHQQSEIDKSNDCEVALIEYEAACFLDEEIAETMNACKSHLKVWDASLKQKVALLKFNLEKLYGKKIRRAYLRLVNDSGHEWNSTATLHIGKVSKPCTLEANWISFNGVDPWQGSGASGNEDAEEDMITKTVFRVPEWQPTWFVDISKFVVAWVEEKQENFGLFLRGGIESQPLHLKCDSQFSGLRPMLVIVYSNEFTGNGALVDSQKIQMAYKALSQIYIARDISWSGSFVRNAQANADKMGWGYEYLKALQQYFDLCVTEDGKFKNVSEEYFYVSSCGQALIHLYQTTKLEKYNLAIQTLRQGLHELPRSSEGIITAGGRVEVELFFCVCPFLAFYHDEFNDIESCNLAVEQALAIFDLVISEQTDGIPLQNIHRPGSKGWSRGMGWMMAGMGKLISSLGVKKHPKYSEVVNRFIYLSEVLRPLQHYDGLWRSIIHDSSKPMEITGSALISLGFEYGAQQGILDESYFINVNKTLVGILKHTKTGIDMGNSFPMNFQEKYQVTDFSGNSDQGYGTWMELLTVVNNR